MKRRDVKSKGEKERYKHLNAEFQRIARRDKKAFLSHQCKEIEENNRMGKKDGAQQRRLSTAENKTTCHPTKTDTTKREAILLQKPFPGTNLHFI